MNITEAMIAFFISLLYLSDALRVTAHPQRVLDSGSSRIDTGFWPILSSG